MSTMVVPGSDHTVMYQQVAPDWGWDLGRLTPEVQAVCSCGWQSEEYHNPATVEAEVAEHFQEVREQG